MFLKGEQSNRSTSLFYNEYQKTEKQGNFNKAYMLYSANVVLLCRLLKPLLNTKCGENFKKDLLCSFTALYFNLGASLEWFCKTKITLLYNYLIQLFSA